MTYDELVEQLDYVEEDAEAALERMEYLMDKWRSKDPNEQVPAKEIERVRKVAKRFDKVSENILRRTAILS